MEIEYKNLAIIDLHTNVASEGDLKITEDEDNDKLSMELKCKNDIFRSEGEYFFDVFQNLKDTLLSKKIGLQCYGSMENVYPSPMMQHTQKAYILKLGEQAKSGNIVNVLDYIEIFNFYTLEEQNKFYLGWLKSLQ